MILEQSQMVSDDFLGGRPFEAQATQLQQETLLQIAGRDTSGIKALHQLQGPVYIGSSTRIEPGAMIHGPTVVGRNCLVETGARIDACIVGDYTRVSSFADLHEKIVSGRFCVDSNGTQVDLAGGGYTFVIDDTRERRAWTADQQVLIDFLRSPEVKDDPKECDTLTSE